MGRYDENTDGKPLDLSISVADMDNHASNGLRAKQEALR
jgi:hypothetical protein